MKGKVDPRRRLEHLVGAHRDEAAGDHQGRDAALIVHHGEVVGDHHSPHVVVIMMSSALIVCANE